MKAIYLSSVLILLSAAAASAGETRKIAFRTLCIRQLPKLAEVSLPSAKPGGKPLSVPLYKLSISQVVEAEFSDDMAEFQAPGKNGTVARGKLAKSKRQLLVFVPVEAEDGPPRYEIHAFDDDLKSFKMGSILASNLAPEPVRITMAGKVMPPLPASGHAVYPQPKEVNDYNMYPAIVEFQGEGEEWTKAYSAGWKASDRRREIVITQVDGETRRPAVKMIADNPPWLDE